MRPAVTSPVRPSPVRPSPVRTVLLLVAGLLTLAAVLDTAVLDGTVSGSHGWRFLLVAAAFAAAEGAVMHVELGKNAHSVSLAEMILTVGLFELHPWELTGARLLGGGLVLALVRHQRPLKLVYNLALWTCDVALAAAVFRALGGSVSEAGSGTSGHVLAAGAAALAAALLDSLAVSAVIAATSRELDLGRAVRFTGSCLVSATGCVTGGIVCVAALTLSPWFAVPVTALAVGYLYAFATLASLRAQVANVRVVNDFADELSRTRQAEGVVHLVLAHTAKALRADRAALWLASPDSTAWHVTDLRGGVVTELGVPFSEAEVIDRAVDEERPVLLRPSRHPAVAVALRQLGAKDAVLASLRGEQDLRAVLLVADRQGEVTNFTRDDADLLQTLARHAGAALSNSRLVEQLDHDSQHDALTGLANRTKFLHRLTAALEEASSVSVLLMDLDRFKEVNDTLGHHHGDLLLQLVAERLNQALRSQDLLARLGGDEFAVLLVDTTAEQATATAERLAQALSTSVLLQGVQTDVGVSVGLVHRTLPDDGLDANTLLQHADVAMYQAKQDYSGVHQYHDELDGYSPRRLELAGGLRAAIESGQLSLRYQPQVRLEDGSVVGAEALVRWEHPTYGEVTPDEFVPVAEQGGLIRELTRYVLDEALAACAAWTERGLPLTVSVNLSARNLLEPDLAVAVEELLARHGLSGSNLVLEITESLLMAEDRTGDVLRALAETGVRLSIDDFGTGYSSLSYLKRLPVAEVKIDKSFVRNLASDPEDSAIIESIATLAHTLQLDVVVEGVEDAATLAALGSLGCDIAQGYHVAVPMTAADLTAWLAPQRVARAVPRVRPLPPPALPRQRRRART